MSERRAIGPVDTMWLNMDRPNNLMVIDGVMWFDGAIDFERLRAVIICPSNPFISVEPILAVPGIRAAIQQSDAPLVGVTPIIGGKAKVNCSLVKNEELTSQWGYALECEVMEIAVKPAPAFR